ncbi:MAG: 4Fe-4S binding protein [Bacteroidetes bacterium]|jgi:ferredoxin|nr:4Fe-4S binding protein [Bacteroidota bacterium]MBT6686311.1 4Fe-4S binding protein [Bacteroidota bacterium]MBT7142144.1 4Fe-4S binding protein [Bacteroidota bacterium]MBT7490501.1 4Fe-4S binding protein [Bacteroidota bacterium]
MGIRNVLNLSIFAFVNMNVVKYRKIIVFYFSGTGNAKRTSQWIVEKAKKIGIESKLINIANFTEIKKLSFSENTIIGFCYPTHGFNAPPIVLKFLVKFPKSNTDIFLINTRAGMKLHKIFTPGISGFAIILPAIILKLKGYRLIASRPLDLPSNWISFHPGLKENVIRSIFARCHNIIDKFADKIFTGKKIYRAWFDLPIDILISPISLGYYIIGRFALAKTFFTNDACNKCGICAEFCSTNAIKLIDNRPYWTFNCESCMKCMNSCPKRAIETAHIFTFFLWWIAFSVAPLYVFKFIKNVLNFRFHYLISEIIYCIVGIIIIWLSYYFLHFLLRYKYFNKIFQYTALTKYKFWRRYKIPKNIE